MDILKVSSKSQLVNFLWSKWLTGIKRIQKTYSHCNKQIYSGYEQLSSTMNMTPIGGLLDMKFEVLSKGKEKKLFLVVNVIVIKFK